MDWDDARVVLAVARAGQMLGAAKRLGLNQATLSRRVSALEAALGTALFHRRTGGCDLTDAGRAVLPRLERIEAEFLAAQAELTGQSATVTGSVRIGAPDGFGVAYLAPRLADLTARFPALTVQLVPLPRAFSLAQREADIAILVERPERGALISRKLVPYSLGLYASERYLAGAGTPSRRDDLRHHRLVGYVEDLLPIPGMGYSREIWPDWRSDVEIASAIGQFEAVRAGAGIGVLHDFMARTAPDLHRVLPEAMAQREYWIAWHRSLDGAARLRAVIDFLAERTAKDRGLFMPGSALQP